MDQREIWDDTVGDAWVRHADAIDEHGQVFGAAAMEALGPVAGLRVLDVGCGSGSTTLALADLGAAEVVGVDLSAPMVALARQRAQEAGADTVRFEVADVTTLGVETPFDAVFSRFGVMFFEDAVAGFAALRSLAAPGGRMAFAAWAGPFENEWMLVPVGAAVPILGPPELPPPGAPGPFSLGDPDHVRSVLGDAGWRDVEVRPLRVERASVAPTPEGVAEIVPEMAPPLAIPLAARPELRDAVRQAIVEGLAAHVQDGEVVLGGTVNVVSAVA